MSITYGFYNSLDGDRRYNATDMSSIFNGILNDGVFMSIGTSLMVKSAGGMLVNIGVGRAWFDSTWTNNDSILTIEVERSEIVLNRIDVVVLDINGNDDTRMNSIKIIKGVPATEAVPTELIKSEYHNQYPLAHISVKKGVTSISQSDITNKVGTVDTPFITGILDTVIVDDLLVQWEDQYLGWFETIRGVLDGDVAGQLLNLIETHKLESSVIKHQAREIGLKDISDNFVSVNLEDAMSELFTNVSNGKDLVSGAITGVDNNIVIPTNPSFEDLGTAISGISTGKKFKFGSGRSTAPINDGPGSYVHVTSDFKINHIGVSLRYKPNSSGEYFPLVYTFIIPDRISQIQTGNPHVMFSIGIGNQQIWIYKINDQSYSLRSVFSYIQPGRYTDIEWFAYGN